MISDVILARLLENGLPLQLSFSSKNGLQTEVLESLLVEAVNFVQAQTEFADDVSKTCVRTGAAEIVAAKVLTNQEAFFRHVDSVRGLAESIVGGVYLRRGTTLHVEVRVVDTKEWTYKIKIYNKGTDN